MPLPIEWSIATVLSCLPAFARAGGFAALAPTLGGEAVALRFRAALAVLLALMLVPVTAPRVADSAGLAGGMITLVISEAAIGLLFGFALRLVFMGVTLATQLVEQQIGLPTDFTSDDEAAATALGRLYQLAVVSVFLAMGGHRLVVAGLLDTPPLRSLAADSVVGQVEGLVGLLAQTFWSALHAAAPMVLALLAANLAVGMIARVLPQFSGAAVVQPVQIVLGLVLVFVSLSAAGFSFSEQLASVVRWLPSGIR